MADHYVIGSSATVPDLTGTPYERYEIATQNEINSATNSTCHMNDGDRVVISRSVDIDVVLQPGDAVTDGYDRQVEIPDNTNTTNGSHGIRLGGWNSCPEPNLTGNDMITYKIDASRVIPDGETANILYRGAAQKAELEAALADQGWAPVPLDPREAPQQGTGVYTHSDDNATFVYKSIPYRKVWKVAGNPCFARGTMIRTDRGDVAIENLAENDLVITADNVPQPIRWIGSTTLSGIDLKQNEKLRPVRIRAGSLGKNCPETDLIVSRQHRILVRSKIAQKMFGTNEVLIAAKQLLMVDGIDIAADLAEVEYFHMLFDQHEVVISNGAETESLYTGPKVPETVDKAARTEIFALFPQRNHEDYVASAARTLASGRMGRKLAMRHIKNSKLLVAHQEGD